MTEQNEQPQNQTSFSIGKMINDAKGALLNPKEHFAGLKAEGGLSEPIIKALVYGVIAGLLVFIYSLIGLSAANVGLGAIAGGAVGFVAFIVTIFIMVVALFVLAVIILVISAIAGGETDFETCVRIASDLLVIYVLLVLFTPVSFIPFLGVLVKLLIKLYALLMMYHAVTGALKGKAETTKIIAWILAALLLLGAIIGLVTNAAVKKLSDNSDKIFENIVREAGGEEALEAMKEAQEADDGTVIFILEKVDGSKIENPEPDAITAALGEMENDDDYIILSHGKDAYIQAMKSGDHYILQYKDDNGLHEYDGDAGYPVVISCFEAYLNPPVWNLMKSQMAWKDAEN